MTKREGRVVVVGLVLFAIGITYAALSKPWVGDACRDHADCAECCAKLGKQPADRAGSCECIAKNR